METEIRIVEGFTPDVPYWQNEQHIWGAVLTGVFGIGLLLVFGSLLRKLLRCSVQVEAEIINILHSTSTDSDGHTSDVYSPEYCYYYEGQEYRVHSTTYSTGKQYQIGQKVNLLIDPAKPEKFYDRKRDIKNAIFVGLIMAVFFAIGIGLLRI